jgi:hypothetical protein
VLGSKFTWLENESAGKVDITWIANWFYTVILSNKWTKR